MEPQDAIRARIRELEQELKKNKKALAVFEPQAEEVGPALPYGSRSHATDEEVDKVYNYLTKHTRQKGYLVSEIAKGSGVHRRKVYNAIDRLMATRVVEQVNPEQRQYRRFRAVYVADQTPKPAEPNQLKTYEKPTTKVKHKAKREGARNPKRGSGVTRGKIREYLKSHKEVTFPEIAEQFSISVASVDYHANRLDGAMRKTNKRDNTVRGAPFVWESTIYEEPKPYGVRPGVPAPPYPSGTSDTV